MRSTFKAMERCPECGAAAHIVYEAIEVGEETAPVRVEEHVACTNPRCIHYVDPRRMSA